MKIGVIASPVPGHLNPLCTLGRALARRGHEVTVFCIPDTEAKIRSEGLNFAAIGEDEFPLDSWEGNWLPLAKRTGLHVLGLTTILHRRIARVMCRDIPPLIVEMGIDALVIDQLQFQGKAIAEATGLPFVSVSCTLLLNRDLNGFAPPPFVPWSFQEGANVFLRARNRLAWGVANFLAGFILRQGNLLTIQRAGRPRHMEDSYSELLQVVPMPQSLDFPGRFRHQNLLYAGSFLDRARPVVDFPWERIIPGRPLIYASCGTLQNHRLDIFEKIAAACESLEVNLVIALGDWRKGRPMPNLPGNPIVVGYAPQLELLEKADLCITHAGPNTAYEALTFGKPMVAIPIANDQPAVGARLARSGAAEVIPLGRLTVPLLKEKIQKVLEVPRYRQKAKEYAAEIAASGGVDGAAFKIEAKFMGAITLNQ